MTLFNAFAKTVSAFALGGVLFGASASVLAHDLYVPKNENESYGYNDSPKQWWSEYRVHDPKRPLPKRLNLDPPTYFAPAPADAKVLFDGTNLDAWQPTQWKLVDGAVECVSGRLATKEKFGAFQLHLEWKCPANFEGNWGDQGNNGVILQGAYEIQVFDSHKINNYPDGSCGSVYGQTPPLVNACVPAGNWQTYDIFFTPAKFNEAGECVANPRVTILQNGVLVQNNQEIYGTTSHFNLTGKNHPKEKAPIAFSGHGCPVQFRNVWIRPLD